MNIVIFGSYNGRSIGDTAILLGLISAIFRIWGDKVEVTVLAMGCIGVNEELEGLGVKSRVKEIPVYRKLPEFPCGVGALLNKGWRYLKRLQGKPALNEGEIRRILQSADLLMVGGGNLLMDLYPAWPEILKLVCDLSKGLSVPYYFIGVGAAPINTEDGKRDLLYCLESSSGVYFRDVKSKIYCEEVLGFSNSYVGPDLAFGLEVSGLNEINKDDLLMVNLAAVYGNRWPVKDVHKYSTYLLNMVGVVDRLVEFLGVKELVIFNTNYPLDEFASDEFAKLYTENSRTPRPVNFVKGRNSVANLLNACSKAKYSLVTRLHAGILSKIAGAHVYAIEYQPKVRDVLQGQTSNTIVESFDSVLDGTAFRSVNHDLNSLEPEMKCLDRSEVDKLLKLAIENSAFGEV